MVRKPPAELICDPLSSAGYNSQSRFFRLLYNVAVGLYNWVNTNDFQNCFTRFCAGGVLVAVPITALFLALQKYYVEGVTGGAVKG